jgi:hypothetical protein
MVGGDGLAYAVMLMDVVGSSVRTNPWQLRMRQDLAGIVSGAVQRQGFDPAAVHTSDTGDGMRLIFPPSVSTIRLLADLVPDLAAALRTHRTATPDHRLRLRVAVDTGLLHRDHGWHGTPLILCQRLCDAQPVRATLRDLDQADLVLVVSARVYDEVVRHGYDGIDPSAYRAVSIAEKETRVAAWIYVPGYDLPPDLGQPGDPQPSTSVDETPPIAGTVTMHAVGHDETRIYQAGRDQHFTEQ